MVPKKSKNIKQFTISSWSQLHKVLEKTKKKKGWIYRGQSDASWKLIPKAGRSPFTDDEFYEQRMFDFWKNECTPRLLGDKKTDMEYLAIAQHHGLVTRLLDWSYSPLVASYFAAIASKDSDAALFMYKAKQRVDKNSDPFKVTGTPQYVPGTISDRIIAQQGLFTIHGQLDEPLCENIGTGDSLIKVIIKQDYVDELLFDLDRYGINTMTMFPDFEGVAKYLEWAIHHQYYWDND